MSLSKTLSASVAAVTIAGAVGLAYAQTTDSSAQPAPTAADTSQPVTNTAPAADTSTPSTTAPAADSSMPSSSTTTTTDTSAAPSTDLEPKADRN